MYVKLVYVSGLVLETLVVVCPMCKTSCFDILASVTKIKLVASAFVVESFNFFAGIED